MHRNKDGGYFVTLRELSLIFFVTLQPGSSQEHIPEVPLIYKSITIAPQLPAGTATASLSARYIEKCGKDSCYQLGGYKRKLDH